MPDQQQEVNRLPKQRREDLALIDTIVRLRRIDALVAEHVMGWHFDGHNWSFPDGEWQACECSEPNGPSGFTTSWDAAGQVVERMRERGFNWKIVSGIDFRPLRSVWRVETDNWDIGSTPSDRNGGAFADTLPLAVCLAALRACGVQVDEVTGF
jgi:hypothetical protein